MADISALSAAATQISTDVGEAIAALDDLKAKVAAGETITQAEVDAITATLTTASGNLDAAVAADDPSSGPDTGTTDPNAPDSTDPNSPGVEG